MRNKRPPLQDLNFGLIKSLESFTDDKNEATWK